MPLLHKVYKCTCGQLGCDVYWPGNGTFCQGSGFNFDTATKVAAIELLEDALENLIRNRSDDTVRQANIALKIARGELW